MKIAYSFRASVFGILLSIAFAPAQEKPDISLKPDDKPGASNKPVQVFILMGQSNMVGRS